VFLSIIPFNRQKKKGLLFPTFLTILLLYCINYKGATQFFFLKKKSNACASCFYQAINLVFVDEV
jgi:hypothetical protein